MKSALQEHIETHGVRGVVTEQNIRCEHDPFNNVIARVVNKRLELQCKRCKSKRYLTLGQLADLGVR